MKLDFEESNKKLTDLQERFNRSDSTTEKYAILAAIESYLRDSADEIGKHAETHRKALIREYIEK